MQDIEYQELLARLHVVDEEEIGTAPALAPDNCPIPHLSAGCVVKEIGIRVSPQLTPPPYPSTRKMTRVSQTGTKGGYSFLNGPLPTTPSFRAALS